MAARRHRSRRSGCLAVCPPLIITEAEIDELMDALGGALDEAYAAAEQRGLLGQKSAA